MARAEAERNNTPENQQKLQKAAKAEKDFIDGLQKDARLLKAAEGRTTFFDHLLGTHLGATDALLNGLSR